MVINCDGVDIVIEFDDDGVIIRIRVLDAKENPERNNSGNSNTTQL